MYNLQTLCEMTQEKILYDYSTFLTLCGLISDSRDLLIEKFPNLPTNFINGSDENNEYPKKSELEVAVNNLLDKTSDIQNNGLFIDPNEDITMLLALNEVEFDIVTGNISESSEDLVDMMLSKTESDLNLNETLIQIIIAIHFLKQSFPYDLAQKLSIEMILFKKVFPEIIMYQTNEKLLIEMQTYGFNSNYEFDIKQFIQLYDFSRKSIYDDKLLELIMTLVTAFSSVQNAILNETLFTPESFWKSKKLREHRL